MHPGLSPGPLAHFPTSDVVRGISTSHRFDLACICLVEYFPRDCIVSGTDCHHNLSGTVSIHPPWLHRFPSTLRQSLFSGLITIMIDEVWLCWFLCQFSMIPSYIKFTNDDPVSKFGHDVCLLSENFTPDDCLPMNVCKKSVQLKGYFPLISNKSCSSWT